MIAYASQQFKKISVNKKEERARLIYHVQNGSDEPDEYQVSVRQAPHPDFAAALDALRQDVLDLCELDGVDVESLDVRGVSFSWTHGIMGATITALRTLKKSNAPLVLNTPFKPSEPYSEEGGADEAQLLPSRTIYALGKLMDEASALLAGKRGAEPQRDIFEEEEAGELVGAGYE